MLCVERQPESDLNDDGHHGARLRLHRRSLPRRSPVERRASTMRRLFVLVITLALLSAAGVSAQSRGGKRRGGATSSTGAAVASSVEPLRSIAGELNGSAVNGQIIGNGRPMSFTFILTRADIVGGQVVMSGDFQLNSRVSQKVQSRLNGRRATADNPWPSARDEEPQEKPTAKPSAKAAEQKQGREPKHAETTAQRGELSQATQDTARKTPPAPGARTEQTQSLYAQ